jgi:DNA-binding CsgD family transcriptional regulator
MEADLEGIIKRRSEPGILIFDGNNRLLYSNKKALEPFPYFEELVRSGEEDEIPVEIIKLCNTLRKNARGAGPVTNFSSVLIGNKAGPPCSVRAFFIGTNGNQTHSHIIALVEKINEKKDLVFDQVKSRFMISNRELEVLKLICGGLSNREIGERLFISEYTVKDHIKNIMSKMGVRSRALLIASLK